MTSSSERGWSVQNVLRNKRLSYQDGSRLVATHETRMEVLPALHSSAPQEPVYALRKLGRGMTSLWMLWALLVQYLGLMVFCWVDGYPWQSVYWLGAGLITVAWLGMRG